MLNLEEKKLIEVVVYTLEKVRSTSATAEVMKPTEPLEEVTPPREAVKAWNRPKNMPKKGSREGGRQQKIKDMINKGRMSPKEIAYELGLSIQSIYTAKNRMKRKGLLNPKLKGPKKDIFDQDESEQKKESRMLLGLTQFNDAKESVDHGMNAKDISENMGVPISEINFVIASRGYEDYTERREN